MIAIETKNVVKKYGDFYAVSGVDLTVEEGCLFGMLGTNGAGKTTLIKMMTGLTSVTDGKIKIFDYDIEKEEDKIKEIVDVSPQETSLAPNLTVLENLQFFARLYGATKEKTQEIIDLFSLEEILSKKAKTLSGGYQRRLSIAIALVSSPKILFLDEPTLGLDVLARRQLWKIIQSLRGKITIVLTSHYMEEIEALCDEIVILSKGNVMERGTVEQIKQKTGKQSLEDAFVSIVGGEEI